MSGTLGARAHDQLREMRSATARTGRVGDSSGLHAPSRASAISRTAPGKSQARQILALATGRARRAAASPTHPRRCCTSRPSPSGRCSCETPAAPDHSPRPRKHGSPA